MEAATRGARHTRDATRANARAWVRHLAAPALGLFALLAAASPATAAPLEFEHEEDYAPTKGILEIVAALRRHIPDDTYRFEAARDLSGRNIYRVSLTRLENMERLHREALRAGYMDGVLAFAKARSLERLRAFDLAAESYRRAAQVGGELEGEARRGQAMCEGLAEAASLGYERGRPETPRAVGSSAMPESDEDALRGYDARVALLEALLDEAGSSHFEPIVREELERADLARVGYFDARRLLRPEGNVRSLAEHQRLVTRHRESKNANRHMLALADLYAELAQEYVTARPPESLWFDPPVFQDLVDGAAKLYEVVANQDGTPEKLEAARRLEAFLAFTLRVDRDRISQ